LDWQGEGRWEELVQVAYQEYAIWLAGLIHKETEAVIKVVRYGITIVGFPNKEAVEGIEKHIARCWPHNALFRPR
jgi:hypothetical protein